MKNGLILILLAFGGAAQAQTAACPPVKTGEELRKLPEIRADRSTGRLDTQFRVQLRDACIPVLRDNVWESLPVKLRTYGFPDPARPGEWVWGFPGPILRLRKAEREGGQGDALWLLLRNELPAGTNSICDSPCAEGVSCATPPDLPTPDACAAAKIPDQRCCCLVQQTAPNCFHGDNNTNLHFHGSHVSPQYPQDDVLLELRPKGAEAFDEGHHRQGGHGSHSPRAEVFYGEVQYKLDPLLWTQPEGTHWYHPHKHGSVSLQVTNGMAGPLLIEGPFDDWLNAQYGGKLEEKVLVFQQVEEDTNLYAQGASHFGKLPPPLINGQVNPTVTMRPGEIQRWRFINATLNSLSQINIQFPANATVKQIAMDGVRFAPENYLRQPLFDPANPSQFSIAPGNRADFLVQAPAEPGEHPVRHKVFGNLGARRRAQAEARDEALAPGPPAAPLFTLKVAGAKAAHQFPAPEKWPAMPSYLKDVQAGEIRGTVNLTFGMSAPQADPTAKFTINNKQFDGSCVDVTTRLGTALEWNVLNTSTPLHPFHIHINPFQVVRNGSQTFTPPYVWQDTIALPAVNGHDPGSVLLYQRYMDFTGEYVLHCHFLGHEDRGMMFTVQTVCLDNQDSFGKPRSAGQPECVAGNLIKAAPQCTSNPVLLRK